MSRILTSLLKHSPPAAPVLPRNECCKTRVRDALGAVCDRALWNQQRAVTDRFFDRNSDLETCNTLNFRKRVTTTSPPARCPAASRLA